MASSKNIVQTDKVINRIYTLFEKTIELDELSIPGTPKTGAQKMEDVLSVEYPLVKVNNYIFSRDELISVKIDCTDFLPTIAVSIATTDHLFLSREMPKDGDIISIAIRSKNDVLKMIRNDYVITAVHTLPNTTLQKSPVHMTLYGELFIPGLKSQKYDFSFEGTTFEALMDFAKRYGLGFATNEDNTNDRQVWLKANIAGDIYVNDLISKAYKDENSFYKGWIDVYYNLNFVNVNKLLLSAENDVDLAVYINNLDKNWYHGGNFESEKAQLTVKVFSNYKTFRTSSFYITSWRPFNKSSTITFEVGTKMTFEMFEHNRYLYEDPLKPKYWAVTVEPIYDKEKAKKSILLRGRSRYVPSEKNTELRRANYNYTQLYEKYPWLGIQYTISNSDEDNLKWDGNHHRNYHLARVQNLINNKELDKLNLEIVVNGNNLNVIKGDKVPVIIIKSDLDDNLRINPTNFGDMVDSFYSGWYIVKGFVINWTNTNSGSILSDFTQEFILTRREWPTPVPVEPIEVLENKQKI